MPKITDPALLEQLNGGQQPQQQVPVGGYVPLTAPNPTIPLELQLKRGQIAKQGADLSLVPVEASKARAEAARAAAEAQKAQVEAAREQNAQAARMTPEQQRIQQSLSNDEILAAIAQARNIVNSGRSTGMASQVFGKIGGTNAVDLAGTLDTIKGNLTLDNLQRLKAASPTGASGMGSLTEKEGQLLASTVASLEQSQSKEKILDSLAKIEKHYRNYQALLNGEDPRKPDVAQRYGIEAVPAAGFGNGGGNLPGGGGGPRAGLDPNHPDGPLTLSQDGMQAVRDPTLAGVNNKTRSLIMAGRPAADVIAYLNRVQPGLGDFNAKNIAAQVAFRAQNPDKPASFYGVDLENRQIPMTTPRRVLNDLAQSAPGAYFANAADALSLGTADNLTANPALTRAGMSAVQSMNPTASILGTVTGGALAGAGIEGGLGRLGVAGGRGLLAPRALAADALYGSAYGAGSADEGDRVEGALTGGLLGAAGGLAGRGATRIVGDTATGIRDASAQYLRQQGIPMTIGQMARNAGPLGRYIAGREDRLTGFSGIGDRINDLRRQSIEGFNHAAFDQALAPLGNNAVTAPVTAGVGPLARETGIETARDLTNQAYSRALGGRSARADPQFAGDIVAARNQIRGIPGVGAEVDDTINEIVPPYFSPQGELRGVNYQPLRQELRQFRQGYVGHPLGFRVGRGVRGVEDAIGNMFRRQAPDVVPALDASDAAYRNLNILADAVGQGINTEGLFTPAQLARAARGNTRRLQGGITAATENRPFFQLTRAGQELLPSKVPDSGTAGRIEAGKGIVGTIKGVGRGIVNAPLYSRGTQGLLAGALLDRPDWSVALGDAVNEYGVPLVGRLTTPAALSYYGLGR